MLHMERNGVVGEFADKIRFPVPLQSGRKDPDQTDSAMPDAEWGPTKSRIGFLNARIGLNVFSACFRGPV